MQTMKPRLKNWLLRNNFIEQLVNHKLQLQLMVLFFCASNQNAQVANYITNGGFEQKSTCNFNLMELRNAYGWNSLDSMNIICGADYLNVCSVNPQTGIPNGFYSFQYPRHGNAFIETQFFCTSPTCTSPNFRGHPRNRLKASLQAGKTYCAKMYLNLVNTCRYGIDAMGMYFSNSSIDTITKCALLLTYINPQVQNPNGNLLIDTSNWIPVTGTFVANGNEKYLVIGNFKPDGSVNTALTNSAIAGDWSGYNIDDVSCIDINLPASAGSDTYCIPGNTVYIGRPQDVGIDEACTWYNLTNTNTPIGIAAGLTVAPIVTTTYIVKQDICGNIKWDTVVVHQTALGLAELRIKSEGLRIYPQPAQDILKIEFTVDIEDEFNKIVIYNSLGQVIREEEIVFKNKTASIKTDDLPNGVYFLSVKTQDKYGINRRFVISR